MSGMSMWQVAAVLQACQAMAMLGERSEALELAAEAKELAQRSQRGCAEAACWHTLAGLHLVGGSRSLYLYKQHRLCIKYVLKGTI